MGVCLSVRLSILSIERTGCAFGVCREGGGGVGRERMRERESEKEIKTYRETHKETERAIMIHDDKVNRKTEIKNTKTKQIQL